MWRDPVAPRPDWRSKVDALGFDFHTIDDVPYWTEDSCYRFTSGEIEEIEAATTVLHGLCLEAVEHVIAAGLYERLSIPRWFIPYIETTWRRGDPSLLGRFDLRYDGLTPPKLLEYNADTPTSLLETAVVQWYWLQDVRPHADQFNSIHEQLIDTWKAVAARRSGDGVIHFTCLEECAEDFGNAEYVRDTCEQAGLTTSRLDISQIGWNGSRFTDLEERPIQLIYKLYPWEWLVCEDFARHICSDTTAFLEPAWKMILSNKGILPILWEMFPDHPNLLAAFDGPERLGDSFVSKPLLGREGANITIVTPGRRLASGGEYNRERCIHQAYCPLPVFDGWSMVVGSWIIGGKAAGIGIREDRNPITHNRSRFVPHYFEPD